MRISDWSSDVCSSDLVDGTTGKQGLREHGSSSDISGFDNGSRALPGVLEDLRRRGIFLRQRTPANPNGLTATELEAVGEDLASGRYDLNPKKIGPDSNQIGRAHV